jgi:hypothetical protein
MAVRIEHVPHVLLRLHVCQLGTEAPGVGDGRIEVLDLHIQVHHRPLLALRRGPARSYVVAGELEDHETDSCGGLSTDVPGS